MTTRLSNALRRADFRPRRFGGLDPVEVSAFLRTMADEVVLLENAAAEAEAVLSEIESQRSDMVSTRAEQDHQAAKDRTAAYARATDTLRDAHRQAVTIVEAARLRAAAIDTEATGSVPAPSAGGRPRRRASDATGHYPSRRSSDDQDALSLTAAGDEARAICAKARAEADQILAGASTASRAGRSELAAAKRVLIAATAKAEVVSAAARASADRFLEQAHREAAEHAATVSAAAQAEAGRVHAEVEQAAAAPSRPAVPVTAEAPVSHPTLFDDALPMAVPAPIADVVELIDLRDRRSDGIQDLYSTADSGPAGTGGAGPAGPDRPGTERAPGDLA